MNSLAYTSSGMQGFQQLVKSGPVCPAAQDKSQLTLPPLHCLTSPIAADNRVGGSDNHTNLSPPSTFTWQTDSLVQCLND